MEEIKHCVYAHINKINGKMYIGQAKGNPAIRWGKGYSKCPLFYNAIKKYGWDNFEHKILAENLTINEANEKEIYFISVYNTTNIKFGYNLQRGGKNGLHSDETKLKISISNKGKHKMFGESNPFYGKTHTKETIKVIAEKNTGKKHSIETIEKMKNDPRRSFKGTAHPQSKPVLQFDLCGHFIKEWDYINQARDCLGVDASTIVRCCKGKQKTAGGYIWKYKE